MRRASIFQSCCSGLEQSPGKIDILQIPPLTRALGSEYIAPFWGILGKMTRTSRRVGIVLFQLGGPDTLEAIEPFLYNLFCDPDIIDFPFARIGRKPLAKLISTTRARKVQHHYATIGGGSPIRRHTERQARALEANCAPGRRCALLCGHALLASVHTRGHRATAAAQCDEVVLLPMYPQYSSTTTGSSLNEWRRLFADDVPVRCVEPFYRNTTYLDAVVEKVNEAVALPDAGTTGDCFQRAQPTDVGDRKGRPLPASRSRKPCSF
jgi:protoheme ferro-lyase